MPLYHLLWWTDVIVSVSSVVVVLTPVSQHHLLRWNNASVPVLPAVVDQRQCPSITCCGGLTPVSQFTCCGGLAHAALPRRHQDHVLHPRHPPLLRQALSHHRQLVTAQLAVHGTYYHKLLLMTGHGTDYHKLLLMAGHGTDYHKLLLMTEIGRAHV